MKSSDHQQKRELVELGDSDLANKVELVINTAMTKAIPSWVKALLIVAVLLQIIGIPTILGTILVSQVGGSNCPQLYDNVQPPVNEGF